MSEQLPTIDDFYPSEIHRLLKIGDNLIISNKPESVPHDLPHGLPVLEHDEPEIHKVIYTPGHAESQQVESKNFTWIRLIRTNFVLYPAIFLAAFLFFYGLFNFSSLTTQVSGWFAKPEDEQILGDNLAAYYEWMGGYYFSVGNIESLEPAEDLDKDGLSNMDEFLIRTNPTIADSDADGISDGIEIINSSNPWGQGRMSEKQKKLADSLDPIKINNRISFNVASNSFKATPEVLGVSKISYDLKREGRLSIPKLGIQVPITWTEDPSNFEADLTKGVVHYPGTALPGEQGTAYISGHSSDYPWKRHPYKQIFARLNALEPGDDVFVDIYGLDGKLYNYRYRVASENVYKPDDQTQFIDNSAAKLNLSTCWPIGTAKDRYVVTAILEGV